MSGRIRKTRRRANVAADGVRSLADILVRTGAIRFGTFTLTSGKVSPYYVDLRLTLSFPGAFRRIVSLLSEKTKGSTRRNRLPFDRMGSIPTAGIAFGACLAYERGVPFLYVRREPRTHGLERRVEGMLRPGDRILIVDEMVTTGKSVGEAADIIRTEGGIVEDALVVLDREEGAGRRLREKGVELHSVARMSTISRYLLSSKIISANQFTMITGQLETD